MNRFGDSIRFPRAGLRPKWGAGIVVGPDFTLSLEGLPRTDAVTGRSPDEEES